MRKAIDQAGGSLAALLMIFLVGGVIACNPGGEENDGDNAAVPPGQVKITVVGGGTLPPDMVPEGYVVSDSDSATIVAINGVRLAAPSTSSTVTLRQKSQAIVMFILFLVPAVIGITMVLSTRIVAIIYRVYREAYQATLEELNILYLDEVIDEQSYIECHRSIFRECAKEVLIEVAKDLVGETIWRWGTWGAFR